MATKRIKLTFPQDLIKEPVIFTMAKKFDVMPNIRRAKVTESVGEVVLELDVSAEGDVLDARVVAQAGNGFDEAALGQESQATLQKFADCLRRRPASRVVVTGHCDERGTTEYNLGLGERRAKAAFQYMMDLGTDPNRMTPVSYGEEVPLDPGHNEEAWAKNRRAEFVEILQ